TSFPAGTVALVVIGILPVGVGRAAAHLDTITATDPALAMRSPRPRPPGEATTRRLTAGPRSRPRWDSFPSDPPSRPRSCGRRLLWSAIVAGHPGARRA